MRWNLDGSLSSQSHDIPVNIGRLAPGWRHPHWGYWLTIDGEGEARYSTQAAQYFKRLPGVLWDNEAPMGAAWWFPSLSIRFASWRIYDLYQKLGNMDNAQETLLMLVRIRALQDRVTPSTSWSAEQGPPEGLYGYIARYLWQFAAVARMQIDQEE